MSDVFGSDHEDAPAPQEETSATRLLGNPAILLWAGISLMVSALLLFTGGVLLHVLGYLFACLVPFTLVALFRRNSIQRTALSGVATPAWTRQVGVGIIVAGFILAILHAWSIASGLA